MKLIFLSMIIFIASCASTSINIIQSFAGDENILIVSKFDDKILVKKHVRISWSSPDFYVNVDDWNINQRVTEKTINFLSQKYSTYSNNEISENILTPSINFFTGYPNPIMLDQVRPYLVDNNINYILLISPIEFNGVFGGNTNSDGLGVFQNTISGQYSKAFGLVSVNVYDAESGKYVYGNGNVGINDPRSNWFYSSNINIPTITKASDILNDDLVYIRNNIDRILDILLRRSVDDLSLGD